MNKNDSNSSRSKMKVKVLARYAVKGLAPDILDSVHIVDDNEGTFPDDRRFALLKYIVDQDETRESKNPDSSFQKKYETFDDENPKWIHKENFLCAFTAPELMASIDSEYKFIQPASIEDTPLEGYSFGIPNDTCRNAKDQLLDNAQDPGNCKQDKDSIQRLLTLWKRSNTKNDGGNKSDRQHLLGPVDLATFQGRDELATFFSNLSNENLVCVTKSSSSIPDSGDSSSQSNTNEKHTHQFGNTKSGVRHNNGDTRTIHIVNAATVRQVSEKIGHDLNPMRFRPNIVIDGLEPWKEFDFVGKKLRVRRKGGSHFASSIYDAPSGHDGSDDRIIEMDVISQTVRCDGVGVDPFDDKRLDIPSLLSEHFPQYGPFLGVYAVIKSSGMIEIDDELEEY